MTTKKYITSFLYITCAIVLKAQVPQPLYDEILPKAEVIAKSFGDSVIIRWAPNTAELWQLGNKYGYYIERKTVASDNKVIREPAIKRLTNFPIKPMPLEAIKPMADQDDYAGVVAQAIYGETFQLITQEENDIVSFFNRATDIQNRFSFSVFSADISVNAARAHGLIFTDHSINKNEKYVYRVYPAFESEVMACDTGITFVNVSETYNLPSPIDVWAVFGDKMVELSWDKELQEGVFTGYIIERSDDKGETFTQINKNPVINLANIPDKKIVRNFYIDSIPENNIDIYYRIRGITPFGEISPPSDTIGGRGIKNTPFIHPMITDHELPAKGIRLKWEIMEEYGYDIKGFIVKRAKTADGIFRDITPKQLDPDAREYTDTEPNTVNYYKVCALNEKGKEFCSFPALIQLPDSIPPEIPVNLQGTIDSSGIVRLQWQACPDDDLQSYRIYRGNSEQGEFVRINTAPVNSPLFYDTVPLKTLNEEVYYRFTSVDKHYNESGFSEVLTLKKPDMVSPVSPVIRSVKYENNEIHILWIPGPDRDIMQYLLYRKSMEDTLWTLISTINAADTNYSYTDKNIHELTPYDYMILAVDDDGLESEPITPVRVSSGLFHHPPVEKLNIKVNRQEKNILLKWKYDVPGVDQYYIYKSVNNETFALYKVIAGVNKDFTDNSVFAGNSYAYKVQAEFTSGNRSTFSEAVTTKF